ncbi:trypsin-like [Lycorma delicatula]|uniref:trypsin-like n=1 Tax=Lycorma delicatula TaxID=130591 RepID=UPI003F5115B7
MHSYYLYFFIIFHTGSILQAEKRPNLPSSNVQLHYNDTNQLTTVVTLLIDIHNSSNVETTVQNQSPSDTDDAEVISSFADIVSSEPCNCVCGVSSRNMRIVGGNETRINEFPWLAMLNYRGKFYCAGTLITRFHVLTAAHCVEGLKHKEISVVMGEHNRKLKNETETWKRKVVHVERHPNFTIATFDNDIAVLTLDKPLNIKDSNLRTGCIPSSRETNYTSRIAVVAGWGKTHEKKPTSDTLNKVAVPILSKEQCKQAGYNKSRLTVNMICAGYMEGKQDACQGDSGGPLHLNGEINSSYMEVIGIVSWGRGCARPNFPGVYTRVANYIPWVKEQLQGECTCSPPKSKESFKIRG